MQIIICSRKECIGVLHIILAALCLRILWILFDAMPFGEDMQLLYHMVATAALAYNGLYFGISSFVFQSRNSFSRAFLRAHNVCTITPLIFIIVHTRNSYFEKYRQFQYMRFYTMDIFQDINDDFDATYGYIQAIFVIGSAIVIIQCYFIYVRVKLGLFANRS